MKNLTFKLIMVFILALPVSVYFFVDSIKDSTILKSVSVVHYGDSLTASKRGVGSVGDLINLKSINRGRSGWAVNDIATFSGAIHPLISLRNNLLLANEESSVVEILPSSGWTQYVPVRIDGTILGIEVSLYWNPENNERKLIRKFAGTTVKIPPQTPFIPTENKHLTDYPMTIWIGRNSVSSDNFKSDTLNAVAAMVRNSSNDKFAVIGVTNSSTEPIGTKNYLKITELNRELADIYGDNFYDIMSDFNKNAMSELNLKLTRQDELAIEINVPPPSLMSDNVHPNDAGYSAQRKLLATWLAGNVNFQ